MENLSHIEVSEICNQLGKSSPKNIRQVLGGDIHESWQIEFENKKFFLKRNKRKKDFLKFEEYCLRNLQENITEEVLIVPKVISYLKVKNVELLLMDWIDMQNGDQKKLGEGLGKMHLKSAESNPKKFGYPVTGYIGITDQNKGWEKNWIDCFINLRIKPQLSILKDPSLDIKTKDKIHEKIKLELTKHKPINTLIHGDLWYGNVGIDKEGKGVIFDPACWWADSEVDIAMTRLFGGFKKEFYEEYHKIIPIKKGLEKRIIIYNFYHILNHANMFGGSYSHQVQDYVKKIITM
tara:strand:- start:203 stop:1081 length:879 start_codon:yes stop_codon:yes gene_type:complete